MARAGDSRGPQPDEPTEEWDAHDPRRQNDPFAPPTDACECFCLSCQRVFSSEEIWFQRIKGAFGIKGFWKCPTPNCGGAGFTFDIFPTDPHHPANEGWVDDEADDELQSDVNAARTSDRYNSPDDSNSEYDPEEPQYQMFGNPPDNDDDMDGEEWKFGLQPGERPPETKPDWLLEEEKKFNQPDERPRELDWTEDNARQQPQTGDDARPSFNDDDIPF